MKIEVLNKKCHKCDAFVAKQRGGKLEHTSVWCSMIQETFGHHFFYIKAEDSGGICGVLPLVHIKSKLFGNRLTSQAFSNYGGPVYSNSNCLDAMYEKAFILGGETRCDTIEFRNTEACEDDSILTYTNKITMFLDLPEDSGTLWKGFNCKVRNQVRKAEKSGVNIISGGEELLNDFYAIWTVRMRELGTPAYSKHLFQNIIRFFRGHTKIYLAKIGDIIVGGGFVYEYNGFVQIRWASTLLQHNKSCPNNLLYWSIMKDYCDKGATCFDFGRCSVDSGTYKFKKQWGSKEIPLYYQYWLPSGSLLSIANTGNPKYTKKIEIWKRLPLWTTRIMGPYISRNLP